MNEELKQKLTERFDVISSKAECDKDVRDALLKAYLAGGEYVYQHAQPYRDPDNPDAPIPQWQKDLAGWVNKKAHFIAHSFAEFRPRKGFTCNQYLKTLY